MSDAYFVGAYWGNRSEDPNACAEHTAKLLRALAMRDEVFGQWFLKGRSQGAALASRIKDAHDLRRAFEGGANRRDIDGSAIRGLGRRVGLWNGRSDSACSLAIKCGGNLSAPQQWIPNSCVLTMPEERPAADRLANVDELLSILGDMISAFDPDWAVVDSVRSHHTSPAGTPTIGWITYLSDLKPEFSDLPNGVRVTPLGRGAAIVVTTARFEPSNQEHVTLAEELQRTLAARGVLSR